MSHKPKTPDNQIHKISKKGYKHENFFRVHRSLFEDEKFRTLSSTAQLIYIAIALQCGREGQNQCRCCLPQSQYEELGFTKKQWTPAVNALEEYGFIKIDRYKSRKPNVYYLSDEWQKLKLSDIKGTSQ